jgi:trimethylamine--corrinoid protein Co-methyltransferase
MPHPGKYGYPQFNFLTDEQCRRIHLASLEILDRTGIKIYDEPIVHMLADAGATVEKGNIVHFPASLVEKALRLAPPRCIMNDRNGHRSLWLEDRNVYFGTGSDCPNIRDPYTGERRPFLKKDVEDGIRLCHALEQIDFVLSIGLISDVPMPVSDIHQFEAMLLNTTKPVIFTAHNAETTRYMLEMAEIAAGGRTALQQGNHIGVFVETIPPLTFGSETMQKVQLMAENNLPVIFSSGALMGASGPQTHAGILALSNAENLAGNLIVQLIHPGAPFIYALGIHPMDMQTTIIPYGAPELSLNTGAAADMAHFYRLPVWGYAGCSDAKTLDQQAAIEATTSIMASVLTGNNLIHDVGYLESGMTSSFEMILLSDTVIGMSRAMLKRIEINEETLALDLIHKVGHGGSYITEDHTFEHFREIWYSKLIDRQKFELWEQAGQKTMGDRLTNKVHHILETTPAPEMPAGTPQRILDVRKRAEDDLV